ncbi:MAG: hypothetical protein ACMUIL_12980 [bacterium]
MSINKRHAFLVVIVVITFVFLAFTSKVMAQGLSGMRWNGWGARVGLSDDPDQVYGGVHLNMGEFARDVRLRPSMELGLGDDVTVLQILAEVHYVFSRVRPWTPYLGGGLGLTYVNFDDDHPGDDSDTEVSLSPIFGIETGLNRGKRLFFELKFGLGDDDPDIKIGVGISWK